MPISVDSSSIDDIRQLSKSDWSENNHSSNDSTLSVELRTIQALGFTEKSVSDLQIQEWNLFGAC
jgi:hypothetical protein